MDVVKQKKTFHNASAPNCRASHRREPCTARARNETSPARVRANERWSASKHPRCANRASLTTRTNRETAGRTRTTPVRQARRPNPNPSDARERTRRTAKESSRPSERHGSSPRRSGQGRFACRTCPRRRITRSRASCTPGAEEASRKMTTRSSLPIASSKTRASGRPSPTRVALTRASPRRRRPRRPTIRDAPRRRQPPGPSLLRRKPDYPDGPSRGSRVASRGPERPGGTIRCTVDDCNEPCVSATASGTDVPRAHRGSGAREGRARRVVSPACDAGLPTRRGLRRRQAHVQGRVARVQLGATRDRARRTRLSERKPPPRAGAPTGSSEARSSRRSCDLRQINANHAATAFARGQSRDRDISRDHERVAGDPSGLAPALASARGDDDAAAADEDDGVGGARTRPPLSRATAAMRAQMPA